MRSAVWRGLLFKTQPKKRADKPHVVSGLRRTSGLLMTTRRRIPTLCPIPAFRHHGWARLDEIAELRIRLGLPVPQECRLPK